MYWPSCPPTVTCKGACSLDQPSLGLWKAFPGLQVKVFQAPRTKKWLPEVMLVFLSVCSHIALPAASRMSY